MKLTSETFRLPKGGSLFTKVEGFVPYILPLGLQIPRHQTELLEVWALGQRLELLCLVVGWRGFGHYEWVVVRGEGLPFEGFSDKGFGSPEAAREEGLAMLRQYLLSWDEEKAEMAGKETASHV